MSDPTNADEAPWAHDIDWLIGCWIQDDAAGVGRAGPEAEAQKFHDKLRREHADEYADWAFAEARRLLGVRLGAARAAQGKPGGR